MSKLNIKQIRYKIPLLLIAVITIVCIALLIIIFSKRIVTNNVALDSQEDKYILVKILDAQVVCTKKSFENKCHGVITYEVADSIQSSGKITTDTVVFDGLRNVMDGAALYRTSSGPLIAEIHIQPQSNIIKQINIKPPAVN